MLDRARLYRETFLGRATEGARSTRVAWRSPALVLADRSETLGDALRYAELDLAQRADRGAWATRGWILSGLGRHGEAIADAQRALEWGAPEPDVLYRAGFVHLRAGEVRAGRRLLRQALAGSAELGPAVTAEIEAALPAAS
jgi:tetratricopeptide (TPR) repeat protein